MGSVLRVNKNRYVFLACKSPDRLIKPAKKIGLWIYKLQRKPRVHLNPEHPYTLGKTVSSKCLLCECQLGPPFDGRKPRPGSISIGGSPIALPSRLNTEPQHANNNFSISYALLKTPTPLAQEISKTHHCSQVKQIVDVISAKSQVFIPFFSKKSTCN